MIFFCDNSGAIFKTVPEKVYQGSVNANTIYLVGAFDGDCAVTARFELPNGLLTTEKLLKSSYTALNNDIQTEDGIAYNVWAYVLKSDITALSGTVGVQFTVTSQNENGMAATVCTARSTFDVERGVPVLQDDSAINYETLLTQIKAVLTALQQGDTENSIASAASAEVARISAENAAEAEQQALAAQEIAQASAESASQSETIAAGAVSQIQSYIKQTEQNTLNITNIQAVLQGNSQYALITLSQAYNSRITANGANIFDGQLTPVESIKGSTVRCKNLFDISRFIDVNNVTKEGNALSINSGYYNNINPNTLQSLCPSLKVGDVVTLSFVTQSAAKIIYCGSVTWSSGASKTITQELLTGNLGVYGYRGEENPAPPSGSPCIISDIQIEYGTVATPYQPYFTGLKNANINSIVSTGKNLLPFPYATKSQTKDGITYEVLADGGIKVTGKNTSTTYNNFSFPAWGSAIDGLKDGITYTISINGRVDVGGYKVYISYRDENGVHQQGQKVTWKAGYTLIQFYISCYTGYECPTEGLIIYPMLNIGATASEYEPYIEHKYQLPQTVELAEFDIINPPEQTLTRYTETIVFETTSDYWEKTSNGLFRYIGDLPETPDITQTGGFGVCNLFDPVSSQNPNGSCGIGVDGYFVVIKQDINSLEDFLSYLQTQETNGNPLTLVYKTAEPVSSVTFNAPQTYEVYQGGIETIVQGTTDNSEYGAMPTITQTYLGKVGE